MPTVSVIIPSYNHAPYLKQRINSVLNQTYQDFELIILDDQSTDYSKEIILSYAGHERIAQIVFNETNSGTTFKQWQKGLHLAQGKYIWIAESDDYADDYLLETLMKPFEDSTVIVSYCQSQIVDDNGSFLHLSNWADPLDNKKWKNDYLEQTFVELKKYLSFRNTIPNASAVVFVKPTDITILDESCGFIMLGDWFFWRNLLNKPGKIAYNAQPLNYFRQHQQTTRSISKERELIRLKEYKRMIIPSRVNLFKDSYDWMIITWWLNRSFFKNTKYYYTPDFPLILTPRIMWVLFKHMLRTLFRYFAKAKVLNN